MKAFKLFILLILIAGFIFWTYKVVNFQNQSWAVANGNVGVRYWLIVPFVWLKVSAFLSYGIIYLLRKIRNPEVISEHFFNGFMLFSITKRIVAAAVDLLLIWILWLASIAFFAMFLVPLYNKGLITSSYGYGNSYLSSFNYLFGFGWYILFAVYFLYFILFEFYSGSSPGKMLNNCWLISSDLKRPNFFQILLKNILKFLPVNEFSCYFKWISLNEYASCIRTIQLNKNTEAAYNQLVKK